MNKIVIAAWATMLPISLAHGAVTGVVVRGEEAVIALDAPAGSTWFSSQTPERVVVDIEAPLKGSAKCNHSAAAGAFSRVLCYSQPERTMVMFETKKPAKEYVVAKKGGSVLVTHKPPVAKERQPEKVQTEAKDSKRHVGKKISLQFSDVDVRKVFQLISEVSGFNFLIADDVSGTVSLKLIGVPWDQALDMVLDSKELGMIKDGNVIQIKPKSKIKSMVDEGIAIQKSQEKALPLTTRVFTINFAGLSDIVSQFSAVKSERGTIAKDERTNKVIVTDIQSAIDKMALLTTELDTPEMQVMIEARIIEASNSFSRDIGMQWGAHYHNGTAPHGINAFDTTFGGLTAAPGTSGTGGPGGALGVSFGKLGAGVNVDLRLSAAVSTGDVKIISKPSVMTLNNKSAKISQGQQIPYTASTSDKVETKFVEAALVLETTPRITPEGMILLKVKASNDSPGSGTPPAINTKVATTEVLVNDGETIVIGGISADNNTSTDTGVPWLKDLPLLGHIFKSKASSNSQNELIIFITPRIVPVTQKKVPVT